MIREATAEGSAPRRSAPRRSAPRRSAPRRTASGRAPFRRLAALALLAALLAACAPGAGGPSAFRPEPLPVGAEEARVDAGAEAFFLIEYPYGEFDLGSGAFSGALWVPEGVSAESANAASSFALRDVVAPPGWGVELVRMRAVRESDTSFGRTTSSERLEAVLGVRVPPDAPIGRYRIEASLRHEAGASTPISFRVRVP